jgi:hypothetical protein
MMALLLVHDVSLWADVCNVAVVDHVYGEVDAFGIVEAEFLPYFAAVPPATTDLPDVLASGYRRSDGRVLLIVANLARQQRSGTVRLNPAGLQLPHIAQVLAWPEKTPLARDGQRLTLTVPGLGYRLLVVEPPAVTLSHNRSEGCVPRATASSTCAH